MLREEYLVYEWPLTPYSFDKDRSRSYDSFARVLGFLFGCDQETCRPAGRRCCPGAERLCQAGGSRAWVTRGHDI
jgi:hypothetical protein